MSAALKMAKAYHYSSGKLSRKILSALNSVYEMELQDANSHAEDFE